MPDSASAHRYGLVDTLRARGGRLLRDVFRPRQQRARLSLFEAFPVEPGDTVFLGDSLTAGVEWSELFPGVRARNRGIGGDETGDVLRRLQPVVDGRPARVALQIGTNDLGNGVAFPTIVARYADILRRLAEGCPEGRILAQSLLPRAPRFRARIEALNGELAALAPRHGAVWIDLYPHFLGPDGGLREDLHYDGLHLCGAGYALWRARLAPYLEGPP